MEVSLALILGRDAKRSPRLTPPCLHRVTLSQLFPLESLELPDWPDLIEIAVDALKDVQIQNDQEEQGASTSDRK